MSTNAIIILVIIAVVYSANKFYFSNEAQIRAIWKIISRDRICRKADLGEMDIRLDVKHWSVAYTHPEWHRHKHFIFSVSYSYPEPGKRGNPWISVSDKFEVDIFSDKRRVEDQIAAAIIKNRGHTDSYRNAVAFENPA